MPSLTSAQSPLSPSRVQRCSAELTGIEGPQRKRLFSDCLVIRLEAERLIERDCRKQFQAIEATQPAPDKAAFTKQCVSQGLTAKYTDLPSRAKPAPKLVDTPASPASNTHADQALAASPASQTKANSSVKTN